MVWFVEMIGGENEMKKSEENKKEEKNAEQSNFLDFF
jgi:hypothetical protein